MPSSAHRIVRKIRRTLFPADLSPLRTGANGTFIFVHINKTAGTSIGKAVGLHRKQHLTAKEIIAIIGKETYANAYKFTVVRNPWDRVVSHYKYRVKTNQTQMAKTEISFSDWVKCTYGEPKNKIYYDFPRMFQPQVEWMKDDVGEMTIDKIIRFENLNEDFETVAQAIGIENNLPHLNRTKRAAYQDYYNEETKAICASWFEEDIERFSYTF